MDAFDRVAELWETVGLSPEKARLAAIGRAGTESAARQALATAERDAAHPPTRPRYATAAGAELALATAARDHLGMGELAALKYARGRREYAERRYGPAAVTYLAHLAESLGRAR